VKLKKLILDTPLRWVSEPQDLVVTGLSDHSSTTLPGEMFFVQASHPKYAEEAVRCGARVVVSDAPLAVPLPGVAQLVSADLQYIKVLLAQRFYEDPSHRLFLCGVTGTNGKTTTTFFIKHLLESQGIITGVIGTLAYVIGSTRLPATLTTPDVLTNYKLLHQMCLAGCQAAAMEVSSHALMQGRVQGLHFDAGVFTNLTQDHLDFHGTMEAYAEAKQKLFLALSPESYAVVNEESAYTPKVLQGSPAKIFSYGLSPDADLCAQQPTFTPQGTHFQLRYRDEKIPCFLPLVGAHNLFNALAAMEVCLLQGMSLKDVSTACATFRGVPGRLEAIPNKLGVHIYVDYAHTPDALEQVCRSLRATTPGRLLVVFGAGGNRDKEKRPKMGAVVDRFAHFAYITADNPRHEDPFHICQEVARGFQSRHYLVEVDRRLAITQAIKMSQEGDIILIAGKGHEAVQVFAHQTVPFDDRLVVQDILSGVRCL